MAQQISHTVLLLDIRYILTNPLAKKLESITVPSRDWHAKLLLL